MANFTQGIGECTSALDAVSDESVYRAAFLQVSCVAHAMDGLAAAFCQDNMQGPCPFTACQSIGMVGEDCYFPLAEIIQSQGTLYWQTVRAAASLYSQAARTVVNAAFMARETALQTYDALGATEDETIQTPGSTHTLHTLESEGRFSIVVPTDQIHGFPPVDQQHLGEYAKLGRLSLDFPDWGETKQDVMFNEGSWWEVMPPTKQPEASQVQKASDIYQCLLGATLLFAGVGFFAWGVASGQPWVALAGVILISEGAPMAVDGCSTLLTTDYDGYMKCEGYAMVRWGGSPSGNRYRSELVDLGVLETVSLTLTSNGPGLQELRFPFVHEQKGYAEGKRVCEQEHRRVRQAAWAASQEWGETTSDSRAGNTTLSLVAELAPIETLDGALRELQEGVFLDEAGTALVVGCRNPDCKLEVTLALVSCGTQHLYSSGSGEVVYAFEGLPDCTKLTLQVGSQTTSVPIPVAFDLKQDGKGIGRD